ncbi:MAG TPA: MFS transporter [Stellaceae bacterium]|nr:MFS transporter [Stellaceae bacterium]
MAVKMTASAPDVGVDLRDVLDNSPVGRMQFLVTLLCGMTYWVDGFDTSVMGALSPSIAKEFGFARDQLGVIFSSAVAGAVCGYLFIAPLSARFGQKGMMASCTAGFGLLSFLAPLVHGYGEFVALRFLTGLFLGAALPGTVAMTGEFAPRRWRATFITFMGLGMSLGLTSASLVTAALLGLGGWRMVMMVCGVLPLVVAFSVMRWLPESVFHLSRDPANRQRIIAIIQKTAPNAGFTAETDFFLSNPGSGKVTGLVTHGRWLGTTAIWTSFFMNLMVNFFMQSWLPTIFIDIGFSQKSALGMSALTFSAGFIAGLTAGPLMDRFGAFRVVTVMYAMGAVFIGLTGAFVHVAAALVLAAAFAGSYFNSAAQKGTGALCIFFYPPVLRATGFGWGSGIGRIGAVIGPVVVGYLMVAHWTTQSLFYGATIPMAIGALSLIVMQMHYRMGGPRTAGAGQPDTE